MNRTEKIVTIIFLPLSFFLIWLKIYLEPDYYGWRNLIGFIYMAMFFLLAGLDQIYQGTLIEKLFGVARGATLYNKIKHKKVLITLISLTIYSFIIPGLLIYLWIFFKERKLEQIDKKTFNNNLPYLEKFPTKIEPLYALSFFLFFISFLYFGLYGNYGYAEPGLLSKLRYEGTFLVYSYPQDYGIYAYEYNEDDSTLKLQGDIRVHNSIRATFQTERVYLFKLYDEYGETNFEDCLLDSSGRLSKCVDENGKTWYLSFETNT
jgi:hypothetical protein